jgi:DNA-binding transcriptional MerR regulator
MQPNDIARLMGITSNTIRRWTTEFYKYLTPQASPPKGKPRIYGEHDQRVFHFIKAARDKNKPLETIQAQLETMHADNWRGLPDIPAEWREQSETMPVSLAASKAYDFAQIAVLQRDLEHTRAELETAQNALEAAQKRVIDLENDNARLRASQSVTDSEFQAQLHAAQLEAEKQRGEVEALKARLSAYAITGGDKPIPVAVIVAVTALLAVAVVVLVFVVARVLL